MSSVLDGSETNCESDVATRAALLLRLEYPADEALIFGDECRIRGRLFLPSAISEVPHIELRVSRMGENHGPLSAGLLLLAERVGVPTSTARVFDQTLEAATDEEQREYAESYAIAGSWFHYSCTLKLPEPQFPLGRYAVFLSAESEQKSTISNPCILRKERRQRAASHWFPQSTSQSRFRQMTTLAFGGFVLCPAREIHSMTLDTQADGRIEVHWEPAKAREVAHFPDCTAEEVTAVGIAVDAMALQHLRFEHARLRIGLADASELDIPLVAPLLAAAPQVPLSCIETIRKDGEGRLELSGYLILPLSAATNAEQLEFGIATFRGWRRLGTAELPGSSADPIRRVDLDERFPQWTQAPVWGFKLSFYHSDLSGRDGLPLPEVRVKGRDRGLPLATAADLAKIRACIGAAEEVTVGRRLFEDAQQLFAPLRISRGQAPWSRREMFNSGQPSRLLCAAHNLSATEGAPRVLLEFLRFLRAQDGERELAVLSGSEGALRPEIEALGVQVHVAEGLHFAPESRHAYCDAFAEAAEFARTFAPDAMYCNTIAAVWGMEIAERLSVPSLWAVHESKTLAAWGQEVDDFFAAKIAHQLGRASHLLFVAESTRALLAPWTSQAKSAVVPNGVDLERIESLNRRWSKAAARDHLSVPPQASMITIVGTTTARKGQDVFVQAAEQLLAREPERDIRFFIVGAREIPFLDQLRSAIAASRRPEAFRLIPETPDVAAYFRASDIMVMCSREESAPLVSLECFAFERPLVSTAVFGLREQLQEGENALLFEVDTHEQLAQRLQQLLQDDALQAKLVAGGRTTAASASLKRAMEAHWDWCCESYRNSFSEAHQQ